MTASVSSYHELIAARRTRVDALTRAGRSASEIAAIEGIARRSVVRIRSELGLSKPIATDPLREDELTTAAALLADGCSYAEVGRTLGRSANAIRGHFPGFGWPPVECGRLAAVQRWAKYRAARAGVLL